MNKQYKDEWLEKANKDYKSAITLLDKNENDLYENVAFHCQQCVEKYLKGFLAYHNKEINRTHSIEKILKQCQVIEDFSSVKNSIKLTVFAVNLRYPGEVIELEKDKINEYLNDTKKVIKLVKDLLAEDRLL